MAPMIPGDTAPLLTGKRRLSALTPLSGCTADSGKPAAELRNMDLSSRVRERAELGEWPADRDEPDASDSFPAARHGDFDVSTPMSCLMVLPMMLHEVVSRPQHGNMSASCVHGHCKDSPSAAPGRKDAPRFRSVSCDNRGCVETTSAVGTSHAEVPWPADAGAIPCAQSLKSVHHLLHDDSRDAS